MKVTLRRIKSEVHKMDPALDETDDTFATAVLLLSAISVGQNVSDLEAFTKLPATFIEPRAKNLLKAGIWKNGKTHAGWMDDETGGIAFWCDVLVAEGMIQRAPSRRKPKP